MPRFILHLDTLTGPPEPLNLLALGLTGCVQNRPILTDAGIQRPAEQSHGIELKVRGQAAGSQWKLVRFETRVCCCISQTHR